MEYWQGYMTWPLEKDWKCETCEEYVELIWGLVHGVCRCNRCHTQYTMYDSNKEIVKIPICLLKEEYKKSACKGWKLYHRPLSEWNDDDWDKLGAKIEY